ncbi:MAG: flagellar motor protein MotB [SAR324 cluster bacterium]|nr:flagellar motor protein MotB [SAR324 cluster bacterium]
MGQMIDEEDCEVCVEFDQEWIFTYGDLVTLLLCFFILLFSMCKMDVEKFKDVAQSFKPTPAGSPFLLEGNDAIVERISTVVENSEISEETTMRVEDHGVVVSFNARALFESGSSVLTEKAKTELSKFSKLLYFLPNKLLVEGHTDDAPLPQGMSHWQLSSARSSVVARHLITGGVDEKKITIKGYGKYRPQFQNNIPEQRVLNNRVEVIVVPEGEQ